MKMIPKFLPQADEWTDALKKHLQHMVTLRRQMHPNTISPEELISKHGITFTETTLNEKEYPYGQERHCFMNALNLAHENPDLIYVEGYGLSIIPVHHAWCVSRDTGKVVDTTWRPMIAEGYHRAYMGIPFPTGFAVNYALRRGVYGILDDWQHGWPVLSPEFDLETLWRVWKLRSRTSNTYLLPPPVK